MKILIASDREYVPTSRGIDVISKYLADQGHKVDHLVFFRNINKENRHITENFRQLYVYDFLKLWFVKLRHFLPGFMLTFYFNSLIRRHKEIDYTVYDCAVIESGFPVFLGLALTCKIIYRQSDPVEITFGSKRRYYYKLEEKIIAKSIITSSALEKQFFPVAFLDKYVYWHSGYVPPEAVVNGMKEKYFVYAGGGQIDFRLIRQMALKYGTYKFVIIGHDKKWELPNVVFHGYIPHKEYLKIISKASVFIIPYTKAYSKKLSQYSYTAKVLVPIDLGIPVIVKSYGLITKSDETKKLFVYNTRREALDTLDRIVKSVDSGTCDFSTSQAAKEFLAKQNYAYKIKELDSVLNPILKT
jgi:glycosyltransferase involved in cell wall biosynthesis